MSKTLNGKRILITGVCGTVGSELINQLLTNHLYGVAEVLGIDNDESALFFMDQQYLDESKANFYVLDIRDRNELINKMRDIDIVFHCAALKHVILSERSPDQAVQTNIIGVQNVIAAAELNEVEIVIFTSSDKAVNPTNVMGTSKLMGERLMTAANAKQRDSKTLFASTRFGNVLGSNGSVVPIFSRQIANGGPLTLTHRDMTRFVMSTAEAVALVIESALIARGGEVLITKMPVIRIEHLAQVMIDKLSRQFGKDPAKILIKEIGIKPGEKLYEELMSDEETRRAVELERYFVVTPAFRGVYKSIDYEYDDVVNVRVKNPYISGRELSLNLADVAILLAKYRIFEGPA
ncbi:polysaccharide biosynthesis protein [Litorivicinus sp.]|nr:polysaccharide biosynthesis protein [Litorivicinus sp.]MDC1239975.1 polysaccharide biosynthesis protein [Litorivicinus sp.]